ncbi:MAG: cupredoxin domain-containing protein [Acetobacteraceae bacterium]|nr:cupredoxin domain-containing protein [Acetobacteraceae bacterium]
MKRITGFPRTARLALGGAILSAVTAFPALAATIDIVIRDLAFVPAEAQAKVGDTVRWRNEDPVPHTVTAPGSFDLSVPVGERAEAIVDRPGVIGYHCSLHGDMKGRIAVTPP